MEDGGPPGRSEGDMGHLALDMCYERPEKYMEEALKPILEFRKFRVFVFGCCKRVLFDPKGSHIGSQRHWQGRPPHQ
jgi:hypothetical protein